MVNFPGSLDSLANPTATTNRDDPGFALHTVISTLNDIAEQLEAKLGVGATTPNAAQKIAKATAAGTSTWGYYGLVKLAEVGPLGSGQATLDFTSIDQNFRSLILDAQFRGTTAANTVAVALRINNDSGANYDYQQFIGSGAAASAAEAFGQTSLAIGNMPGSTAAAGLAAQFRCEIANYVGTTFNKTALTRMANKAGTGTGNLAIVELGGFWRSTAAITRVTLIPNTGNFDTGSVATLWGVPSA